MKFNLMINTQKGEIRFQSDGATSSKMVTSRVIRMVYSALVQQDWDRMEYILNNEVL